MIEVTDGLLSVRVTSEDGPAAGERVTIEFARGAPALDSAAVKICYSLAKGDIREIQGTPAYLHTTAVPGGGWLHHYRLSHWAPAASSRNSE